MSFEEFVTQDFWARLVDLFVDILPKLNSEILLK